MPLFGVDVSSFQSSPDYAKVKASGVSFVIAKATEGITYTDPQYARNRAAIPASGLIPGAYHFLRGTHDGASQADSFIKAADPAAIHALDVECLGDVHATGKPLDVAGFINRHRQHYPGKPLLIYTGRDFWRSCSTANASTLPLWAAGNAANTYVPGTGPLATLWLQAGPHPTSGLPWGGWTTWTFLQFTDKATVPGINGGVDGDAFNGTLDQLRAFTGATTPEDDVPLTDADKDDIAARAARAIHSQQIYRQTWTGADGTTQPLLFADALLAAYRRQFPTADQVAAAVKAALAGVTPGTVTGTTALTDADIAKLAKAVWDEGATRLVR